MKKEKPKEFSPNKWFEHLKSHRFYTDLRVNPSVIGSNTSHFLRFTPANAEDILMIYENLKANQGLFNKLNTSIVSDASYSSQSHEQAILQRYSETIKDRIETVFASNSIAKRDLDVLTNIQDLSPLCSGFNSSYFFDLMLQFICYDIYTSKGFSSITLQTDEEIFKVESQYQQLKLIPDKLKFLVFMSNELICSILPPRVLTKEQIKGLENDLKHRRKLRLKTKSDDLKIKEIVSILKNNSTIPQTPAKLYKYFLKNIKSLFHYHFLEIDGSLDDILSSYLNTILLTQNQPEITSKYKSINEV